MREFRTHEMQKSLAQVQQAAMEAPILFLNRGRPRTVLMSVEEFARLKRAAGEPPEVTTSLPSSLALRRPTAPGPRMEPEVDITSLAHQLLESIQRRGLIPELDTHKPQGEVESHQVLGAVRAPQEECAACMHRVAA